MVGIKRFDPVTAALVIIMILLIIWFVVRLIGG